MLEIAAKEVKSVAAKREISLARSALRVIRAELKGLMIDDEVVRGAIRLADRHKEFELSAKLQKFLEVDTAEDQDDYLIELKDGKWKASVVIKGKTYKLGSYEDPQSAVDDIDEFKGAFNDGDE